MPRHVSASAIGNLQGDRKFLVLNTLALKMCDIKLLSAIVSHEIHSETIVTIWWKILFPWMLNHTSDVRLICQRAAEEKRCVFGKAITCDGDERSRHTPQW